jgi:CRISPR-associated protein Cas5t
MTKKTLLLKLFQPFAQYRNPFTFYYAQTYPLPPKSTIIGMLQNACDDWYGHKFGIEKWWNLKVSVHGGFESVFWNYQQLIKGELLLSERGILNKNSDNPGGNIWLPLYGTGLTSRRSPTYQQELFNGHLYIFIRGDVELIEKIKEALEHPSKVLSLGRSEDVIFIKEVEIFDEVKEDEAEGDLKLTLPTYIIERGFPIKISKYPVYSIPTKVIFKNQDNAVKHKSEITKTTEREVEYETVIYTGYDYWIILKDDQTLKVEIYDVEDKKIKILSDFGWL